MNVLPQELIDRISNHLTHEELKETLTLNKAFNVAAERQSGIFRCIELTESTLTTFAAIYGGTRLRLLREVVFRTYLTPITDADCSRMACRETQQDLNCKDNLFSKQIRSLFSALEIIEQKTGKTRLRGIHISIYGPIRRVSIQTQRVCLHHNYISWRVRLLSPQTLPILQYVRSLQVSQGELTTGHYDSEVSKLDLRIPVDMASRLPNLEFISCALGQGEVCPKYVEGSRFWSHYERDWEGPRRDSRYRFADALKNLSLPASLTLARLDFLDNYSEQLRKLDQQERMPDLVGRIERDPFSASLSTLSHNLRVLELRGLVDLGCFERYEGDDLPWPNLESLMVMFWPVCPSGSWYFQGPKGEGRHTKGYLIAEQHYPTLLPNTNDFVHDEYLKEHGRPGDNLIGGIGFRVRPNEETLVPFLTAFAKAAVRMPKLKDLNLWSPLIWYNNEDDIPADWLEYEHLNDRPLAWGLAYDKPTAKTPRKLTWRVSTWRPDDQLHTLFQDIGRQEHGNELVEDWVDEQYGDNLVGREFFSDYEVLPSHSLPWH